jgi:hypothetical protein
MSAVRRLGRRSAHDFERIQSLCAGSELGELFREGDRSV